MLLGNRRRKLAFFTLTELAGCGSNIFQGDILILQGFKGSFPILLEKKIDMEIRWIIDHPFLKEIMAGCQFINMPQSVCDKIKDIVDSE